MWIRSERSGEAGTDRLTTTVENTMTEDFNADDFADELTEKTDDELERLADLLFEQHAEIADMAPVRRSKWDDEAMKRKMEKLRLIDDEQLSRESDEKVMTDGGRDLHPLYDGTASRYEEARVDRSGGWPGIAGFSHDGETYCVACADDRDDIDTAQARQDDAVLPMTGVILTTAEFGREVHCGDCERRLDVRVLGGEI